MAFQQPLGVEFFSGYPIINSEASGSLGPAALGGNRAGDELLKFAPHVPFARAVPRRAQRLSQKLCIVGIVLKKHVPESVADNLATVLIDAGLDLLLQKFFKLFAQGYIHRERN